MKRRINIGDRVICTESGVIGIVTKFYIPTASEEQRMVDTDDGRQYHAPTRCWTLLTIGMDVGSQADQSVSQEVLVKHDYRDIKLTESMTITIDLEELKKTLAKEIYRDFDFYRGLRSATDYGRLIWATFMRRYSS